MTLTTPTFETETCSRCGGSGHYSYNQLNGTVCFKCRGAKVVYTKRGAAAVAFAKELRAVNVQDVKPGNRIYWGNGGRMTVTASKIVDSGVKTKNQETGEWITVENIEFTGQKDFTKRFYLKETVRKGWTTAMVAEVNAYQDNLTKAGKPRKRPVK